MEVYIDTMEAQWRKDCIQRIIDGINADKNLAGEDDPFILKVRRLEFSDFCAGDDLALEFKEPGDFINSIRDKRIFDQSAGMRMNFKNPRIVLNCAYSDLFAEDVRRGFHPNAIRALIPSLIFKHQVNVDFTGGLGRESFRNYMKPYLEKALYGRVIVPHIPVRPSAEPKDHMRAMLSCFPNIGEKKVEQIMSKYSNLREFIDNPAKMLSVRGWGIGTVRKIEAVIDNQTNEWWDVVDEVVVDNAEDPKRVKGIPVTPGTKDYKELNNMSTKPMSEMSEEERRREMMRY